MERAVGITFGVDRKKNDYQKKWLDIKKTHPLFTSFDGCESFIFVSNSHKGVDLVCRVIKTLNDKGVRIRFDEGISIGDIWNKMISEI
ncbi:MAG: hypothetical protein ACTSXT_16515 [Candidatus Helarchaeota archaeon]